MAADPVSGLVDARLAEWHALRTHLAAESQTATGQPCCCCCGRLDDLVAAGPGMSGVRVCRPCDELPAEETP